MKPESKIYPDPSTDGQYRYISEFESQSTSDKEILGGARVFQGTRVPVRILNDHLEFWMEEFLDDYPTVSREQALIQLIECVKGSLSTNE